MLVITYMEKDKFDESFLEEFKNKKSFYVKSLNIDKVFSLANSVVNKIKESSDRYFEIYELDENTKKWV